MRPKLLDLYGCEGGAAKGWNAHFDVYGVDLFKHVNAKGKRVGFSQKRYPYASHQGDVLDVMAVLLAGEAERFCKDGQTEWLRLSDFDVIHASPPCQRHSAGTRALDRNGYPDLVGPTRELLIASGLPYTIENVVGAPLLDAIELCGCMFGLTAADDDGLPLRMERPRLFESNMPISAPRAHAHDLNVWVAGAYGGSRRQGNTPAEIRHNAKYDRHGGYVPSKRVQQKLLGVDWMTVGGMYQCVPPAYTAYLGSQILDLLSLERAA